jgi:hypothetical protein
MRPLPVRERGGAKLAHTANDGKTLQVVLYNLEVIISVGYRVKSKRCTKFRIWATSILKDHMIKDFIIIKTMYIM